MSEPRVEVRAGDDATQPTERALFGDLLRSGEKSRPRRPRERAANADPADADAGERGDVGEIAADPDVDRPRRDRVDDRLDIGEACEGQARRGSRPQPRRTRSTGGWSPRDRVGRK